MTEPSIHLAKWVLITPWHLVENGYVAVQDGCITAAGSGTPPPGTRTDHGAGVLMAGAVNAHTHLELSALAGHVETGLGFQKWVAALLRYRDALDAEAIAKGTADGIAALYAAGCRVVGDISTLGRSRRQLCAAGLAGVWFHEFLGHAPGPFPRPEATTGISLSLAAHAPHTTAPEVITAAKNKTRQARLPMSIHLAESEDEWRFIVTGSGPWSVFLRERGIDFTSWPLPAPSPVAYLDRLGVLDERTLGVHLLMLDDGDLETLRRCRAKICVCPRSNLALHGRVPDIPAMLAAGLRPCLGTDSLASAPDLSIFHEMAFTARCFPGLAPETIVAMGTVYGASALGMPHWGDLTPGRRFAPVFIPVATTKRTMVMEAVLHAASFGAETP